jgi:hypothetical protein
MAHLPSCDLLERLFIDELRSMFLLMQELTKEFFSSFNAFIPLQLQLIALLLRIETIVLVTLVQGLYLFIQMFLESGLFLGETGAITSS